MRVLQRSLILIACFMLCVVSGAAQKKGVRLLPMPNSVEWGKGYYKIGDGSGVSIVADDEDRDVVQALLRQSAFGFVMDRDGRSCDRPILLEVKKAGNEADERYTIDVTPHSIHLAAASGAGLFYGVQTLLQIADKGRRRVASCHITDAPRFRYRGLMLDVSRHFFDKTFVKKQIDAMARYKLNRLHLHLTDAAGWRIEIKRYPRLTSLGAFRSSASWKTWWFGDRKYVEHGGFGGYYTQDDIRELVDYARRRHVTIIPEIEMPAHSEEVLTAYPELSCTHEPYKQADFCPGNEATFTFLENVLTEVMNLFPSPYIHIGGDEAGRASWKTCPLCQKRVAEEHLSGTDALQGYLIRRIGRFLERHGRRLIGWDEIVEDSMPVNAAVMSWRGEEGGKKAMRLGHHVVMSPGAFCYLDAYQDAPATQPEAIGGYLPLEKVYSYQPADHPLMDGVQGNLWTEYVGTAKHAEEMIYPRILALAEVGWTQLRNKDYARFRQSVIANTDDLLSRGYHPFDIRHEAGNRKEALHRTKHLARGCKVTYGEKYADVYAAGGDSALTDGWQGGWTYGDGRWQGFIGKQGADVTVDLGSLKLIKSVSASFMQAVGAEVFLPAEVKVLVSKDGINYSPFGTVTHAVTKDKAVDYRCYAIEGKAQCRYVRLVANKGPFGGWIFTDEVIVR